MFESNMTRADTLDLGHYGSQTLDEIREALRHARSPSNAIKDIVRAITEELQHRHVRSQIEPYMEQ